jgi:hypothetical protein
MKIATSSSLGLTPRMGGPLYLCDLRRFYGNISVNKKTSICCCRGLFFLYIVLTGLPICKSNKDYKWQIPISMDI